MKALTALAATFYAILLWLFAPKSLWQKELEQAKGKQQRQLATETEQPQQSIPEMPSEEDIAPEEPQQPETMEAKPEETEQPLNDPIESIPDALKTDYTTWTTNQLREEAKQRKLNWRPLINGKRKPLNKPQLIELLAL